MTGTIAFILCFVAAICYAAGVSIRKFPVLIPAAAGLGSSALLLVLLVRSFLADGAVLTGSVEVLVFFALMMQLLTAILAVTGKLPPAIRFASGLTAFAALALASSPLIPAGSGTVVPVLRSVWLPVHVGLAFTGEVFFTVAFWTALFSLLSRKEDRKKSLDVITYRSILIGFPIYTLGALVFGAVWAQSAWGRYWSWDPKETWALITFLVYSGYLHQRLVGRNSRFTNWLAVVGYLAALFTFFGVNFLLSGLHSYR